MRRTIALVVTGLALLSVMMPVAASAESSPKETPSDLTIAELEIAPDGYWTDERISAAIETDISVEATLVDTPPTSDVQARDFFGPTPFPEEPQQRLAWGTIPSPLPPSITHGGVVHTRTVGKIIAQYDDPTTPLEPAKDYACTGTVVTSQSGSLLITAGHCIRPRTGGIISSAVFIPAYHEDANGVIQAPSGQWNIESVITKDCWSHDFEMRCDQAFMSVALRSDGKTIQQVVGSIGLTIGGQPERGATPSTPYFPDLTMLGYPVEGKKFLGVEVDESRAYECSDSTTAADQDAVFEGAVQFYCDDPQTGEAQPIIGGMSGAALLEMSQGGQTIIGTLVGRPEYTGDLDQPLYSRLNNTFTKELWEGLDDYVIN